MDPTQNTPQPPQPAVQPQQAPQAPSQPQPAQTPSPTQAVQSTAPMPNTPSSRPMKKTFFVLLAVLILLLVAGGSYYLGMNNSSTSKNFTVYKLPVTQKPSQASATTATPTPDPTASWKVFTNTKYGYSIKYPTGLTPNEQDTYYHYVEFKDPSATGALPAFIVSVIPDTFTAKDVAAYNYMSSDWIANIYTVKVGDSGPMDSFSVDSTAKFTRLPDMTIGGQSALVINVTTIGYDQHRVYIKANGNYYMVSNYYQPSDDLTTFNNFLSSFKLTVQ